MGFKKPLLTELSLGIIAIDSRIRLIDAMILSPWVRKVESNQ